MDARATYEIESSPELTRNLRMVLLDGIFSQLMVGLTSGVILINFALDLGASNLIIGAIAAIPLFGQIFQIPSIYFVEKYKKRKLVALVGGFGSRSSYVLIILLPLFIPDQQALWWLLAFLLLHSISSAITSCGWSSWMHDLIPKEKRSIFFSRRMAKSLAVSIPTMLFAGFLLDWWEARGVGIWPYSLFFSLGLVFGLISMVFITKTGEPAYESESMPMRTGNDFKKLLVTPLRNQNYRNMLIFLMLLNFAIFLASPFYAVYLLDRINLDVWLVMLLTIISQVLNVLFLSIWGRIADNYSNTAVLNACTLLLVICMIAWTFTTLPSVHFFTLPLLFIIHSLTGIAMAGINLSSLNIGLTLAPKGKATSYLALKNFLNSIIAGIAPIIGGLFVDFFKGIEFSIIMQWISPESGELVFYTLNFQYWDFFFFFAFIIGLVSLYWNTKIKEGDYPSGKLRAKTVLFEVKRSMRNFSSISTSKFQRFMNFTKNNNKTKKYPSNSS